MAAVVRKAPKNPKVMVKMANARRLAYKELFFDETGKMKPAAETFLADLKSFCRGGFESTFVSEDPNGRISALLEGRREVWNRISLYIGLTEEDIRFLREQIPSASD